MRITIKIALGCALIWIVAKVAYHLFFPNTGMLQPMILLNMLLLLSSVSFGLFYHKKQEGYTAGNALSDIKAAMTSGVVYAVIVSVFALLYYSYINPEFTEHQISEMETAIQLELDKPEGLKQIRSQNEEFEVLTKEQIYEELTKGLKSVYSAQSTFVLMLLGLVLLSTIYSLLVTIIFRKILFRKLG
ncbi:MAG: DUF4199 family protein [Bacteroidetes bacterium]|nr:MAG: DUF4199 family protein [Bacteroidota bacterium]